MKLLTTMAVVVAAGAASANCPPAPDLSDLAIPKEELGRSQGLAIADPLRGMGGVDELLRQVLARIEIFDPQHILLGAVTTIDESTQSLM